MERKKVRESREAERKRERGERGERRAREKERKREREGGGREKERKRRRGKREIENERKKGERKMGIGGEGTFTRRFAVRNFGWNVCTVHQSVPVHSQCRPSGFLVYNSLHRLHHFPML